MANKWHNPNKMRKKRSVGSKVCQAIKEKHEQEAEHAQALGRIASRNTQPRKAVIADSGTNVNVVTPDFILTNERNSETLPAMSASKGGIEFISKGEHTVGTGFQVTSEKQT